MPGITGIISYQPSREHTSMLEKMVDCMKHESWFSSGTFADETLGVRIGWTAHQGSFSDCMPVWNETRDVCLIMTGETFLEGSDLEGLRARGHQFDRDTASYVVHLYEEQGAKFFENLNGLFSGVLLDLRNRRVTLFNDRYGLGRIYYCETKEGFFFSSESKSLLRVLPSTRAFEMRSLGEYLSCGAVLQNRSLYQGISVLPAASLWTFERPAGNVSREVYFKKESWERQEELPVEQYYQRLKEVYTRIAPKYFSGKQDIALSLTGGLDSRMIISVLPPGKTRCYSFAGMYRTCVDARLGQQIATICGQTHETIRLDKGFFKAFPDMVSRAIYQTDGSMDAIGSANTYVNRLARSVGEIRMTGNYGSEVLRGNVCFKPNYVSEAMFDQGFVGHYRQAADTFAEERRVPRTSFIVFKQMPWHHHSRYSLESAQLTIRSPFLDNELVKLSFQAPQDVGINKELSYRLIAECKPQLAGVPTDRGRLERPALVPAKAWYWWKEFLPRAEYVYDYGMPQSMVKVDRLLHPLKLERIFLGIQKYYHFRTWYRHELAPFVKELLLDPRTLSRPYLDKRKVERMVTGHVTGRLNNTVELHKLIALELIERKLLASS